MKAAKAWCMATIVLMAGISLASCGKDEGTNGGGGMVLGGTGGSGGGTSAGTGGNLGRAGSDGGGTTSATKLGQACVNDTQCADPTAPGLKCVTATDTVLGDGAPPKGLCTAPCTITNQDIVGECAAFGAGAICYPFGDTNDGYCVEGCSFGEPAQGDPKKCHGRGEFACYPALVLSTGDPCTDDTDCQNGEVCDTGECSVIQPACLPACRGDIDCGDLYCDQAFLHGSCISEKPTGKGLGEPCTVKNTSGISEPDECLGFCQADKAGSTQGHCASTCGIGRPCAWNSDTEKFDGACLFVTSLTQSPNDGTGDFGYCALTCECTDGCMDSTLACALIPGVEFDERFRGPGACLPADYVKDKTNGLDEYNQCGAGGAGGAPSGGAGGVDSGGAGAGGMPSVDGGAGAAP
jgi:hypothetical protein